MTSPLVLSLLNSIVPNIVAVSQSEGAPALDHEGCPLLQAPVPHYQAVSVSVCIGGKKLQKSTLDMDHKYSCLKILFMCSFSRTQVNHILFCAFSLMLAYLGSHQVLSQCMYWCNASIKGEGGRMHTRVSVHRSSCVGRIKQ